MKLEKSERYNWHIHVDGFDAKPWWRKDSFEVVLKNGQKDLPPGPVLWRQLHPTIASDVGHCGCPLRISLLWEILRRHPDCPKLRNSMEISPVSVNESKNSGSGKKLAQSLNLQPQAIGLVLFFGYLSWTDLPPGICKAFAFSVADFFHSGASFEHFAFRQLCAPAIDIVQETHSKFTLGIKHLIECSCLETFFQTTDPHPEAKLCEVRHNVERSYKQKGRLILHLAIDPNANSLDEILVAIGELIQPHFRGQAKQKRTRLSSKFQAIYNYERQARTDAGADGDTTKQYKALFGGLKLNICQRAVKTRQGCADENRPL